MKEKIKTIKETLEQELNIVTSTNEVNDIRVKYMGKKGLITDLMSNMSTLSIEEKKELGQLVNEIKNYATDCIEKKNKELVETELNEKLSNDKIDVTLPGAKLTAGFYHPMQTVIDDCCKIFISMGYDVVTGPEVETDKYNFEMLNLPHGHPARDMQDSFYITEDTLLRTHTSPVQVRTMLKNTNKEPIRIVCPGKTYRRDNDDATHSHQFAQIEGLVIDENISLADLKGTLEVFVKELFGSDKEIRFRPSFFPFTEPSYEVDMSCTKCGGKGCNICKETGWIEILGSGMVHPNVLVSSGYDSKKYTGFAFGIGIERIAMLKYGINDIRDFYQNDMRFLHNFNRIGGDK